MSLRLPVPPIPSQCMLGGFLIDGKRPAFISHCRPGNTIKKHMHNLCLSAQGGKIQQFEAVAGLEPSANGIGTVHSVAVTRRLIHGGGYLTDWTRKLLSLSGDARHSAWAAASHLDSAGSRTRLINTPCTRATMSAIWRCRERVLDLTYINIRLPDKG